MSPRTRALGLCWDSWLWLWSSRTMGPRLEQQKMHVQPTELRIWARKRGKTWRKMWTKLRLPRKHGAWATFDGTLPERLGICLMATWNNDFHITTRKETQETNRILKQQNVDISPEAPLFDANHFSWWNLHDDEITRFSPYWLVKSQVLRRFHSSIPSGWHFLNASIPQKDPKRASTMADSLLGRTSSWTSSVSFSQRTESSVGDCAGTEGGSSLHWFNGHTTGTDWLEVPNPYIFGLFLRGNFLGNTPRKYGLYGTFTYLLVVS